MIPALLALLVPWIQEPGLPTAPPDSKPPLVFDAAAAEHLFNRAGFGARPLELEAAVRDGLELTLERMLAPPSPEAEPYYAQRLSGRDGMDAAALMDKLEPAVQRKQGEKPELTEELKQELVQMRVRDRLQLMDASHWWLERMLSGRDPLRERMTLFWHGWFTSSMDDVKSSYEMIQQNELLRTHALGSFRELLQAIARDPAMLEYLDNDVNRKGDPNENFARELMELFTLGEGHYTEQDVKEAARAFTGWRDVDGEFEFSRARHDFGEKTVLGVTGNLDGDDVIEILLDQPACAHYVASRILSWFEGVAPEAGRLERYALLLRESDWRIDQFLGTLLRDPDFYREELRGQRIASPIDYLVGSARRLGVEPPTVILNIGARVLGQRLFYPPSVKGWEEGEAWIGTSSLMQRGNLAGLLLGVVHVKDVLDEADLEESSSAPELEQAQGDSMGLGMQEADRKQGKGGKFKQADSPYELLEHIEKLGWTPQLNLLARLQRQGLRTDEAMVDGLLSELLGRAPTEQARAGALELISRERESLGFDANAWDKAPRSAEDLLRKLAHLILSLPEAQLN